MMACQETRFGRAVLQGRFLTADQLEACWEAISPERRQPDAIDRRLARAACERGFITRWQAHNLLNGVRPQSLWFDRYVLIDVLGQGGMGRVYLAKDNRLGRRVALKVLSRERVNNPRAMARFRREAKVGAQLQHENLVRIYDEGEVGENLYLVMEYIEGKNVGQLILARGPLPAGIAVRIARQVASGLHHAHRKGMVHRDVNPTNILIDRDGTVKLTDLGLALDLGDQGDAVTRDGATVGTFDYISPEQARHSRSIDIRSDIYSLGCTLYHMLAGRVPFPQPSLPEKLYAHQSLDPEPLESLLPHVPDGLSAIVRRMLAKRPEDRYETPGDLAQALAPLESGPVTLAEIQEAPEVPIFVDPAAPTFAEPTASEPAAGAAPPPAASPDVPLPAAPPRGSDIFGSLPDINTGPAPLLSETIPSERRAQAWKPDWRRAMLVALAVLVLGMAIRYLAGLWGGDRPEVAGGRMSDPDLARPTSSIVVRWRNDGAETSHPTLADAVRSASGKDADVILSGTVPIDLTSAKPIVISGGPTTIRAASGARPVVRCDLPGPTGAFMVKMDGSLTLIGLTLACDGPKTHPNASAIRSAGHLRLERCEIVAGGTPRAKTALHLEGRGCTLEGCVFRGFDAPLEVWAFAGSDLSVGGCLFVRQPRGGKVPSWAISLSTRRARNDRLPRRVQIEGSAVVGAGLLHLDGVVAVAPVEVEVNRTVVDGPALLGWAGAGPFAEGLTWSGRENRYAISGDCWLELPTGVAPPEGAVKGELAWWTAAVGPEADTTIGPVMTPGGAGSVEDRPVSAFAGPAPGIGIDPARVGLPADHSSPESR